MISDRVTDYYMQKDCNCAESIMRAASDEYGWNLSDETIHALGSFGAGCGCGQMCGALAGCIAALGVRMISTTAHQSPDLRYTSTQLYRDFKQRLGNDQCKFLKSEYFTKDQHCLGVVLAAAELLQEYLDELNN